MNGNIILTYSQKSMKVTLGTKPKKATRRKPRKKLLNDHPRLASKSVRILDLLASKGEAGMTTTQIRKALWDMTYPDTEFRPIDMRGYWSTNLTGSNVRHGLLTFFAKKKGRRWIRNNVDHENSPWKVMDRDNGYKHVSRARNPWNSTGSWMQMPTPTHYISAIGGVVP